MEQSLMDNGHCDRVMLYNMKKKYLAKDKTSKSIEKDRE